MLAIALLWGLAQASGQPLPVVIDTPLGRLDSSHRAHLIERYFPNASHQVLLLSTDTEIDDPACKRLEITLVTPTGLTTIQCRTATTVRHGYFWEQ